MGDPRHVAEVTTIPRPPDGAEHVPAELSRLLDGHETIIDKARELAGRADELEDHATNDLLASSVLPINEREVWFVAEHLVDPGQGLTPVSESERGPSPVAITVLGIGGPGRRAT